jgi:hypothetical protein
VINVPQIIAIAIVIIEREARSNNITGHVDTNIVAVAAIAPFAITSSRSEIASSTNRSHYQQIDRIIDKSIALSTDRSHYQ